MFKTEKWKESNHLALNFFRPLANPHILPVMYLYIIFLMLPPWEMSQKILCATEVTEQELDRDSFDFLEVKRKTLQIRTTTLNEAGSESDPLLQARCMRKLYLIPNKEHRFYLY